MILKLNGISEMFYGISKNAIRDLLNLANKESFFTFKNKFYILVEDAAIVSLLGPKFANIYFSRHE